MRVWFRWLSYAQPVSFGFEALLANEFRTLNVPCVSLIPAGAAYPGINIANQVCAGTTGATAGSSIVNGLAYIEANFGYKWSNAWRNLGFIIVYFVFFMAVNLIFYEIQRDESVGGGVMLFRRGAQLAPEVLEAIEAPGSGDDPEKGDKNTRVDVDKPVDEKKKDEAAETLKAASDIFTWRNVCYDIQIKGEPRRLLDNVSGYVRPGALTCRTSLFPSSLLFLLFPLVLPR
jgi:hypothetical protein